MQHFTCLVISATRRGRGIETALCLSAPMRKTLIWYVMTMDAGRTGIFLFQTGVPFLQKFDPKFQSSLIKVEIGTQTNSNMQNLMVIFHVSVLDWKHLYWKSWSENQNCQFKLKFDTQTHSSMQNERLVLTFCALEQKYIFWVSFIQKLKIVSFLGSFWYLDYFDGEFSGDIQFF